MSKAIKTSMKVDINQLLRPNIRELVPYSSARDEFTGKEGIFLDANENALGSVGLDLDYNRYPDPYQAKVKTALSVLKNVRSEQIFLGNGSDEAIDLLIRAFCRPSIDRIVTLPPTYGMYKVSASINDVAIEKILLKENFQIDVEKVLATADEKAKILFICSPNNPTGNLMNTGDMISLLDKFPGIVVVDEAYIDFINEKSMLRFLDDYPNLVILQTFSKAWGMAGLRVGMAYASKEIIQVLNKIKPPYNLNIYSQEKALEAIKNVAEKDRCVTTINKEKARLKQELDKFSFVKEIYPSDANFLLMKTTDALGIYQYLTQKNIVIRNRSTVALCEGCLRITIGLPEENETLLTALNQFTNKAAKN